MRPFDRLTLETTRLTLRPLRESDIPALFAMYSDPTVMQYWSTPPWQDEGQARKMLDHDREEMPAGQSLRLGLERKDNGALIGTCCLFSFMEQCRRAEIGYSLTHAAWGQGYMHEALSALIAHAFTELDLRRIEADIDPRNGNSARSLERLGFAKEGHMRERWIVDGVVSDSGLYGLLRTDWEAADKACGGRSATQAPRADAGAVAGACVGAGGIAGNNAGDNADEIAHDKAHDKAGTATMPQVRPANAADCAAIAAIYSHYVKETTVSFEEDPPGADEMAQRLDETLAGGLPWLVLEQGGTVQGYAYASKWKGRCAYRHSVETTVYLDPRATGRGFGRQLCDALLAALRGRGLRTAIAGIAQPNQASVALHEKLGFEKVAHFRQVGQKFGQWIDVGYWQLAL